LQLVSHYLFDPHFCLVRRANEKGVVESMVRYTRSNFLVLVPEVRDLEELNEHLEAQCREELTRKLRGKSASKQELLREDQAAFRAFPDAPFDANSQIKHIPEPQLLTKRSAKHRAYNFRFKTQNVLEGWNELVILNGTLERCNARNARDHYSAMVMFAPMALTAIIAKRSVSNTLW
jgi:hypothetical protein